MTSRREVKPKSQFKLLFITRKFPPSVGGLQRLAHGVYKAFTKRIDVSLIAWGGSQKWLPVFLPFAFLKSIYLLKTKRIQTVYLTDALLAPLGLMIKTLLPNTRVVATVTGLDVTYQNPLYQMVIPPSLKKLDKLASISRSTIEEAVKRGIPRKKFVLIHPGINPAEYKLNLTKTELREGLGKEMGIDLEKHLILLTVGRLVKRKGHEWFIKNIVPNLPNSVVYLIAGTGPREDVISKLVSELRIKDRVCLLGSVSEERKVELLNCADIFIMPNIKVPGDVEGFGIVAIEASAAGLPVIASDIEGIKDAVEDCKNGYLVQPGDSQAFIGVILNLIKNPKILEKKSKSAKRFSAQFNWDKISELYLNIFK